MKRAAKYILIVFSCFLWIQGQAQEAYPYRKGKIRHRISLGPAISFYKNHPEHTIDTHSKFGFNAAYKTEILLGRKTNVLAGLEFMSQGVAFHGYYQDSANTYLFDRTYNYLHEIRYEEVQLPISFKLAFNNEKDKAFTPYGFGGIGFRYIVKAMAYVESDSTGAPIYDGKTDLTFENHIVDKHFNAFYEAGLGLQRNYRTKGSAFFFEFTYKYSISRLHYVGNETTNNLNIRDANLSVTLGLRF